MARLKKTSTEIMKELLAEQEKVNQGYDNALETAKSEYNQLEQEFYRIQEEVKNVHKAYVLNQITVDTYTEEKKRLAEIDEKLRDAGYKLNEINQYRTEDLRDLLTKMEEVLPEYAKEKVASETIMRYKALNAKYEYLKAIREFAVEHTDVWKVSREVDDLRVELGLKSYNYTSLEQPFRSLLSNTYDGTQGINITETELQQAFFKGTFDNRFIDEIENGKQAGII
ncbi:hypothetical protein RAH41_14135 [Gottfriedia acidiceleris]|uniref:hypothetical protein n=1 Tax=Gottfriedia acidiceleris TaxID=371036 RepID=UPI002F263D69